MRIFLLFQILFIVCAAGAEWQIEQVHDTDGGYFSMVLDSSDNPYISFGLIYLWYACWNGSTWEIELLDTEAYNFHTSIALDSSGYPHISCGYNQSNNYSLKYYSYDGSGWSTEVVDENGGAYTSLVLDASDYPHISYVSNGSSLKYAFWNGSQWQKCIVDNSLYCECTSLALDASGNPCIAYTSTNQYLKFARWNGTQWQISLADSGSMLTSETISLALDQSDNAHISYIKSGDVKYTRWNGSEWQIETVDTGVVTPLSSVSMVLNSSGNPCIAYSAIQEARLKYACRTGSAWQIETIDYLTNGTYAYLLLDSSGLARITCHDDETGGVLYVREYETGIENETAGYFLLMPLFPNPSSGAFSALFTVPGEMTMEMLVFDTAGRLVDRNPPAVYPAGNHQVQFSVPTPGIYFFRVLSENTVQTRRLVVVGK